MQINTVWNGFTPDKNKESAFKWQLNEALSQSKEDKESQNQELRLKLEEILKQCYIKNWIRTETETQKQHIHNIIHYMDEDFLQEVKNPEDQLAFFIFMYSLHASDLEQCGKLAKNWSLNLSSSNINAYQKDFQVFKEILKDCNTILKQYFTKKHTEHITLSDAYKSFITSHT